jgi:hypothetical protein
MFVQEIKYQMARQADTVERAESRQRPVRGANLGHPGRAPVTARRCHYVAHGCLGFQ